MINYAYAQAAAQQPSMLASFIPLILIFLIYTWKKESEKKGLDRKPNP